jgi:hypothetical protein
MLRSCTAFRLLSPSDPPLAEVPCHPFLLDDFRPTALCLVIPQKPIKVASSCPSENTTPLLQSLTTPQHPMSSSESGTDFDSTAEMSLSPGNDLTDDPVGLSNPEYVAEMRKMLDVVNRLRATG